MLANWYRLVPKCKHSGAIFCDSFRPGAGHTMVAGHTDHFYLILVHIRFLIVIELSTTPMELRLMATSAIRGCTRARAAAGNAIML